MIIKRESKAGANDLHTTYRPCLIEEIYGHETNKNVLKGNLDSNKVPHCYLFTGPAGCGKTTAARILALGLNCDKNDISASPCLKCVSCQSIINYNSMDVMEINVGQYGRKDDVLEIIKTFPSAPFNSRFKVIIFDEAQDLTPASQNSLLKIIENGYSHVYFIFCTNEPQKLKSAFVDRCNIMHFGKISTETVENLLINVSEFEGMEYDKEVLTYLAEESQGVPRRALVWLKQINDEHTWTLDAAKEVTGVVVDENSAEIIELSRALMAGSFKTALGVYKKVNKLTAENIRRALAGYFASCLRRARKFDDGKKYSQILDILTVPIYDTGKLAEHKLVNYMFKIVCIKKEV